MITYLKNIIRLIIIKIRFPQAVFPHNATLSLNCKLNEGVKILDNARLGDCKIGRYTYIGMNSQMVRVTVGSFTSIGPEVICGLASHPLEYISTYPGFYTDEAVGATWFGSKHNFSDSAEIVIGSDVWIGARAIVLSGVTINDGAVIGAGAIVTKDVPAYGIAVGIPAKVIRYRFDQNLIQKLLTTKWWELPKDKLKKLSKYIDEPVKFIENLEKL